MQLTFNDQVIQTNASTLEELLKEQQLSLKTGIAVAVNDRVVQRARWEAEHLSEHDVILVITAAAGG
jgi:thiamine biosynthesis protein ThiS